VLLDELSPSLEEAQREDLETINNNGRYLLDLINDILDMARIEAGRITLHREPTRLLPVVEGAVDVLRSLMSAKPVTIRIDVSPELPLLDADPTRLRQILINLLSNALKFTDRGQIVVRGRAPRCAVGHAGRRPPPCPRRLDRRERSGYRHRDGRPKPWPICSRSSARFTPAPGASSAPAWGFRSPGA
jgi:hypothetical protein